MKIKHFEVERKERPLGRSLLLGRSLRSFFILVLIIAMLVPYCFAADHTVKAITDFKTEYGTVTYNGSTYTVYNYSLGPSDDRLDVEITVDLGLKKKNPKYNFYFGGENVPTIGNTITSNNDFATFLHDSPRRMFRVVKLSIMLCQKNFENLFRLLRITITYVSS